MSKNALKINTKEIKAVSRKIKNFAGILQIHHFHEYNWQRLLIAVVNHKVLLSLYQLTKENS